MLWRLIQAGLLAGFLTAVAYSVVQAIAVTPLILEAEIYETGAAAGQAGAVVSQAAPVVDIERYALTFLANIIAAVGFAFVLVAAFVIRGRPVDLQAGLWWGAAGYTMFILSPALGLPPEVPGAAAAALDVRQLWWGATVGLTGLGLALMVFGKQKWLRWSGVPIVLATHLIGAPQPDPATPAGPVPPELAAHYVVWSLVAGLAFWLFLGAVTATVFARLTGRTNAANG